MEDTQIDPVKLKEEIKAEAVKEAQNALIERLSGNKPKFSWEERGKDAPESYDELFNEVQRKTPTLSQEDIDARVEAKLAEREEARKKAEEAINQQKETEIQAKRQSFDQEWYDLVNQGKMPKVADDVQARIDKGEKLTMEEIEADEGLKARLELAKIANGKSAKVAFYEDYNKQPAGANAPVFGGRPATPQEETQELDYADIEKRRKKIFGF